MSTRNNEDRFGSFESDAAPAASTTQTQTNPLEFATPTDMVELPSKGKFYPEGHVLHNAESVELRYMTAKDEDILVNRSLIKKGVVLDRLLQSVLVNKKINIEDLLIGDKNAMLVSARITGYGSDYATRVPCPSCGTVSDHVFDLEEALEASNASQGDTTFAEQTERGTFLITLPKTGVSVEVRPLTGKDEKAILKTNTMRQKNKMPELGLTDQMKMYIVSVNGEEDGAVISNLVDNMPAIDSRHLRTSYSEAIPSVDLAQHFECPECSYEQEMEVPFTSEFFWPKR
jgi:predicted RNA-binding Zn-ribbon protein involved in translation (DUF1610 family)